LSAFAHAGHDEMGPMGHEAPEKAGMMETMQQIHGNMKDILDKTTDPEMQKKVQEIYENMGKMIHEMDGMMCMGPMHRGMMNGMMNRMKMHGMMGRSGMGHMHGEMGASGMGPMHGEMMQEMTEDPATKTK